MSNGTFSGKLDEIRSFVDDWIIKPQQSLTKIYSRQAYERNDT